MSDTPRTDDEPFFIEVDENGCRHCGSGRNWTVVGPDGVALGQSWGDAETASDLAEYMNSAYYAGRISHEGRLAALERELAAAREARARIAELERGLLRIRHDDLAITDAQNIARNLLASAARGAADWADGQPLNPEKVAGAFPDMDTPAPAVAGLADEQIFQLQRRLQDATAGSGIAHGHGGLYHPIEELCAQARDANALRAFAQQQAAEIERLREDAERYRGVRELSYLQMEAQAKVLGPQVAYPTREEHAKHYDAEIDAARARKGEGK